ncbi:MAG: ABC transporter ATP-binding protein [Candidatus Cloacimonetes bacterium]|nr:ABC transporter ATP-binding protein [Candidatus Cloacimonadota bacterium]
MSLSFKNISFKYNNCYPVKQSIFSNFSLNIQVGEKVCIFGKTGSGKSTLIKLLTGEEKLQQGKILFQNKDIKKMKNLFENIAILFQKPEKQFVFPNIKDEVEFISERRKVFTQTRTYELADKFNFPLKSYLNRNIYSLSPGELKLLQIILVLSLNKPYWILDDPFLFLDEDKIKVFKEILANSNDKTILILSRNKSDFAGLLNREIFLNK